MNRFSQRTASRRRRRAGRLRQDGAGRSPLQAHARALRHRRRDQRHLHQGGCPVPDPLGRAGAGAHRRGRDRRLPAYGDPRGCLDQSRRGRRDVGRDIPALDLVFIESGGDNLAATFSPELADLTLYVIDVSAGDKIPRKGGPGITRSDLLIINKIDLAPLVGADLAVMDRDARKMRGERPFIFTNLKGNRASPRSPISSSAPAGWGDPPTISSSWPSLTPAPRKGFFRPRRRPGAWRVPYKKGDLAVCRSSHRREK